MKNFMKFALGFFSGCIVMCGIFYIMGKKDAEPVAAQKKQIIKEYGDSFLDLNLLDYKGERVDYDSFVKPFTFVFYVDSSCKSCLSIFPLIENTCGIYSENIADIIVLWKHIPDLDYSEKKNVPQEYNYSVENYIVNASTPTFFILDQNKEIIFTTYQKENFIKKIASSDIVTDELIQKDAFAYILEKYKENENSKKIDLVYFSMVGCPDCEAADEVMKKKELQDKYNIITLYRDRDMVPNDNNSRIDAGDLLAEIFGVDWYPTYMIKKNENLEILGETPIENLYQELLNLSDF